MLAALEEKIDKLVDRVDDKFDEHAEKAKEIVTEVTGKITVLEGQSVAAFEDLQTRVMNTEADVQEKLDVATAQTGIAYEHAKRVGEELAAEVARLDKVDDKLDANTSERRIRPSRSSGRSCSICT